MTPRITPRMLAQHTVELMAPLIRSREEAEQRAELACKRRDRQESFWYWVMCLGLAVATFPGCGR